MKKKTIGIALAGIIVVYLMLTTVMALSTVPAELLDAQMPRTTRTDRRRGNTTDDTNNPGTSAMGL